MEPLSLEGQGVVLRIDGAELSAPLISLGFAPVSRESHDTTHLKTDRAKTYAPGKLNDRGSLEAVIDHDPQCLRLTLYPPGSITILYPLRPGQTEPDRRDLYGFIERQGAEEMRTDQRAVTRLLIRLTDPQIRFNGYITSTYTSTWTGSVWGPPVLVSTTVVSVLPVGVNSWTATGTTATGTFTGAAGTGDFNGILGVVPPAPVLPLPNVLPPPAPCLPSSGTSITVTLSATMNGFAAGSHVLPRVAPNTYIKYGTGGEGYRILVRSDKEALSTVRTISTTSASLVILTKELGGDPSLTNHPENNVCASVGMVFNQYTDGGLGAFVGTITITAHTP